MNVKRKYMKSGKMEDEEYILVIYVKMKFISLLTLITLTLTLSLSSSLSSSFSLLISSFLIRFRFFFTLLYDPYLLKPPPPFPLYLTHILKHNLPTLSNTPFNLPDLDLAYREPAVLLVSEHLHSVVHWQAVAARAICKWGALVLSVEGLLQGQIIVTKGRARGAKTWEVGTSEGGWEVTFWREVEKESVGVPYWFKLFRRLPLSIGVPSDAIPVFNLKQTNRWSF